MLGSLNEGSDYCVSIEGAPNFLNLATSHIPYNALIAARCMDHTASA